MKKNYYDILQVNKNASPEIIEKAYKTLAKKYHPDLQPAENKNTAEEIIKEINEAYEVLKDPEKKKAYDASLSNEKINTSSKIQQNKPPSSTYNTNVSNEEATIFRKKQIEQEELRKQELFYQEQLEQARKKAYYDAYIQDLKNRGYKIRYKKSFKDYLKCFIAIIISLFFLLLVFQIPFVKNYFYDLYLENPIIKLIVDCVLNLFK